MIIQNIISKLISRGIKLIPCTHEEIHNLEKYYKIQLPEVYKEFLSVMGHYSGGLFDGSDYTYSVLFNLKEWMNEEEIEFRRSTFSWSDNIFIFLNHGGYRVYFFNLNEGDDPPVYVYHEGIDKIGESFKSFSFFLENRITLFLG